MTRDLREVSQGAAERGTRREDTESTATGKDGRNRSLFALRRGASCSASTPGLALQKPLRARREPPTSPILSRSCFRSPCPRFHEPLLSRPPLRVARRLARPVRLPDFQGALS